MKRQVRGVLSRCKFLAARESISARMLGELLGREIPVYPDMGYFLDPAPGEQGRERCLSAGVPLGDKPCVGLTLRPWRFPGEERPEEKFSEYLASMASLLRHIAERGMVQEFDHPTAGKFPALRTPLQFSGFENPKTSAPPLLGADTDAVLSNLLGLSSEAIGKLRERGAI